MRKRLLTMLVLLAAVVTGAWAVENRLYLDVSGTSATLKYGSYDGKPSYSSGTWYDFGDVKTTVQTITTDATSCANFSGTTLKSLFDQFTALTSVDLSGLNTANVTNMAYMFNSCSSLTSFNLSGLNTDKVTAMNALFNGCTSLTSVDLSGLNTANVTDMTALFGGCTSLTSVDLSGLNTSKVTKMASMFNSCSSLTSVDLSSWDTSSATSMGSMFFGCSALTSVNLSSFNTSNVTIMGGMFHSCSSLTTLDLSSFNTSKVNSMTNMFFSCTNLATIYVGNDWSTDAVNSSDNMFKFCTKLPNFNSSKLDHTNAHTGEGGYLKVKAKTYKVTLQEGTEDADKWTIPAEAEEGATVTATYSGTRKVKSVKAVKKNTAYAANEYNEASWDSGDKKVIFTKKTAASVTAVTNSDTDVTWGDGWYTVSGNVTINGKVTLSDKTSLILQDGATLTINGQLDCGTNKKNLDIYGQAEGTGKVNVTCNDGNALYGHAGCDLHIYGGEITATATGADHHGVYFGSITMYSGKLTATAADYHAIGFGNFGFTVFGGEVEATSNATSGNYSGIQGTSGLAFLGGKVKGTGGAPSGKGFDCSVRSGTSNNLFYFSDDGATWGAGFNYNMPMPAQGNRYAKAE